MTEYEVYDDARRIQFAGVLLASVTSATPQKQRWLELSLYRTAAGAYVLAGVGRSEVAGEVDRKWAQVSLEPEGIVDRLTMFDEDTGAEYVPKTSRQLLEKASDIDGKVARAWRTHHVA